MVALTDPDLVSRAIVIWAGEGRTSWPVRDERFLVEEFGDAAIDPFPLVLKLHDEFYESDARSVTGNLVEMGDLAVQEFRLRHPEIAEEAVEALAWC